MLNKAFAMGTIPAEKLDRAVKFYTEVLGLKKVDVPGGGGVIFEAGNGSRIFMYERNRTKAEHTALSFQVDDIEKTVKDLIAKGVKFEQYHFGPIDTNELGIANGPEGKAAWLTDPEGNILALISES